MATLPESIRQRLTALFSSESEIRLASAEIDTATICTLTVNDFARHYGYDSLVNAVVVPFKSVSDYLGMDFSLDDAKECCKSLIAMHGNLNLADFAEFYGRLKLSMFGKRYGKFTISDILYFFNSFYFESMAKKIKFAQKTEAVKNPDESERISLDEWIRRKKQQDVNFNPDFNINLKA